MRMMPRTRAWMFSSVVSGSVPASTGSRLSVTPATAASIGSVS